MQLGRPEWPCSSRGFQSFNSSLAVSQSSTPTGTVQLQHEQACVPRDGTPASSLFRDGVSRSEAWDGRDADLFRPLIRACTGSLCRLPPVVLNRTGTLPVRSIVLVRVTGVSRVSFNRCVPCVPCVRSHTQTHIHIHTSTSHTKAGPARGRFKMATCPW